MEFYYQYWASCGVGSTVTFDDERGGMEVTATLAERDSEKAVLQIVCRIPGREASREMTFTETLLARLPDRRDGRASGWNRDRKGARPPFLLSPVQPAERSAREGDEVIDIAGEEWFTHWIEKPARYVGSDVCLKYWISERIPGGLVKWEIRRSPEDISPFTWVVKSFERK